MSHHNIRQNAKINVGNLVRLAKHRVGHHVLLRSERIFLLRSFKECNVLLHSFLSFWRLMRKNVTLFCKERKRTQRLFCSLAKNVKKRKNVSFFCKRTQNVAFFFQYIYIDIYRYIYKYILKKEC